MEKPIKVMGEVQASHGVEPAGCLYCGAARQAGTSFACRACYQADPERGADLWGAWRAGKRDFPRPLPVLSTAPVEAGTYSNVLSRSVSLTPEAMEKAIKNMQKAMERPFTVPAEYRYGIDWGAAPLTEKPRQPQLIAKVTDCPTDETPEATQGEAGTLGVAYTRAGNLSALELIQSRKPEPYICPVDDWDLLPDAGR